MNENQPWQGALLSGEEIRELVLTKGLIENYLDLDRQLQPNGFDLRIKKIEVINANYGFPIIGVPFISFIGKYGPSYREYNTTEGPLQPGYYLVTMAEKINLPSSIAALPMNRTSLFRFGSFIAGGWYDVGYLGIPQTGLFVTCPISLTSDSRILQLGFLRVNNQSGQTYSGSYQGI